MDPMSRKRNASDGDSGFDSALSSRSSSISLDQESPDFGKQFFAPADYEACDYAANLLASNLNNSLREGFLDILNKDEDIEQDEDELLLITNRVTGCETLFKPPSRLTFCKSPPQVATTHSSDDYDRNNAIPRNHLFHARLEYELEKQIDKMDLVEVDLVMETGLSPPPSLGIRVIGVNMIHGVPDKLNIYVKRVVEDSVAGSDGRIRINDHIVEVNGISLVGVSQKLAAQTLSNCAICPETGKVHFVLARPPLENEEKSDQEVSGKEAAGQENLDSLEQSNALSSKDQELAAKRQRLKNEESMDTTDNLVSHTVQKEVMVNGLTLPKDAMVVPLMKELLQGSYWGDGETFRPERFLDADGKCKKDDHLIPFSIGKRQCLGETLAKAELFLFFTGILQQFEIKPEIDGELPSEDYDNGVTVLPKPFKLRLQGRMEG